MYLTDQVQAIVPVLKHNNRKQTLSFFENTLGMTTILEEGAWVSLGDKSKQEKLVLEEAPSMRTKKVKGLKKLAQLRIKVENPAEIESLLAKGVNYTALYRGEKGYAFEAISPDEDVVLVYADAVEQLERVEVPTSFKALSEFNGLTSFSLEQVVLHVPDQAKSQAFYDSFLGKASSFFVFKEAEGADLTSPASETWDIAMFKFLLADFDSQALSDLFSPDEMFLPKSKKFLLTQDPSQIELWFEADDR